MSWLNIRGVWIEMPLRYDLKANFDGKLLLLGSRLFQAERVDGIKEFINSVELYLGIIKLLFAEHLVFLVLGDL